MIELVSKQWKAKIMIELIIFFFFKSEKDFNFLIFRYHSSLIYTSHLSDYFLHPHSHSFSVKQVHCFLFICFPGLIVSNMLSKLIHNFVGLFFEFNERTITSSRVIQILLAATFAISCYAWLIKKPTRSTPPLPPVTNTITS